MNRAASVVRTAARRVVPTVVLAGVAAAMWRAPALTADFIDAAMAVILFGWMVGALGYGVYLQVLSLLLRHRSVSVVNGQMVVRNQDEQVIGSVRLSDTFVSRCIHYDGEWAIYRVSQDQSVVSFALPRHDSGDVVKALQLPWPPSSTPYGAWLR